MGLISLLLKDPKMFAVLAVLLLYSVILHEVSHGLVAGWFGDDTAKRYGRLTLNPLPHIDPVGALLLFLVGFGWARPVPVNYALLRPRRIAIIAVALAGCAANLCLAVGALLLLRQEAVRQNALLSEALPVMVRINIILCAFNLLPIPPLDGSKILYGFFPAAGRVLEKIEPFGFVILIILLATRLLEPMIDFMQRGIYGLIAFLFHFFR